MTIIDASGLLCPFPLLQLQKKLKQVSKGEIVELISTDKGSIQDIRSFCEQTSHLLMKEHIDYDLSRFIFTVQKNTKI
jgi:tRNA 2-thiouridine synthesizing protein A